MIENLSDIPTIIYFAMKNRSIWKHIETYYFKDVTNETKVQVEKEY